MRITPPNMFPPMHIARAYGVQPTAPLAQTQAARQLVAGNVSQAVSFDAAQAVRSAGSPSPAVFQMYTRAADRVEAAVGVQIGRSIDVKG